MLLTPFFVHEIQFISNKLCPSSCSHDQHRELVFLFSHRGSHFLKSQTRLFVEPYGQSDLSSSIFQSNDKCFLAPSLNKVRMKYVLHNKFRMIIFHDIKALPLIFKSSRLWLFICCKTKLKKTFFFEKIWFFLQNIHYLQKKRLYVKTSSLLKKIFISNLRNMFLYAENVCFTNKI